MWCMHRRRGLATVCSYSRKFDIAVIAGTKQSPAIQEIASPLLRTTLPSFLAMTVFVALFYCRRVPSLNIHTLLTTIQYFLNLFLPPPVINLLIVIVNISYHSKNHFSPSNLHYETYCIDR